MILWGQISPLPPLLLTKSVSTTTQVCISSPPSVQQCYPFVQPHAHRPGNQVLMTLAWTGSHYPEEHRIIQRKPWPSAGCLSLHLFPKIRRPTYANHGFILSSSEKKHFPGLKHDLVLPGSRELNFQATTAELLLTAMFLFV